MVLSGSNSVSKLQRSVRGVSSSLGRRQEAMFGAAVYRNEGKRDVRGITHRTWSKLGRNCESWSHWVSTNLRMRQYQ